jgi:hypothetical protein
LVSAGISFLSAIATLLTLTAATLYTAARSLFSLYNRSQSGTSYCNKFEKKLDRKIVAPLGMIERKKVFVVVVVV